MAQETSLLTSDLIRVPFTWTLVTHWNDITTCAVGRFFAADAAGVFSWR